MCDYFCYKLPIHSNDQLRILLIKKKRKKIQTQVTIWCPFVPLPNFIAVFSPHLLQINYVLQPTKTCIPFSDTLIFWTIGLFSSTSRNCHLSNLKTITLYLSYFLEECHWSVLKILKYRVFNRFNS